MIGNRSIKSSFIQLSRRAQTVEVAVFLFLILPSMGLSFLVVQQGDVSFVLAALSTILRDLALVSLILFFLWRNGEPVSSIGLTFKNRWRDVALGAVLFLPFFLGASLLGSALQALGFSLPKTPPPSFLSPRGVGEYLLAFVLVVAVATAEETIFRGYLILRFRAITANTAAAALLSAAIFSLGHGYEGSAGVLTVGIMGVVFAVIYLWRQSLVAPMVIHFLQDFIGIVLLPQLGNG
jgi:membrane protease YdiL (CAAX protease family)